MKRMVRFLVFPFTVIIIITMIGSIACAPKTDIPLPSTPEPIITATAVPTATPTPTASPVPTPTPIFSEARMAELNQQFQEFLNKEGEFTPEKTQEMMMTTISLLDYDKVGLGIADNQPVVQGYFFDYFEKDNRLILLMGFDGKDEKRFITPVEIPLYIFEVVEIEGLTFPVKRFKENYVQSSISEEGFVDYGERAKLIPELNAIRGKVIGFRLSLDTFSKEGLREDDEFSRIVGAYLDEVNSKVDLSFGLFQLVTSNDIEYDWEDRIGDSDSIIKIKNSNDINDINVSDVPIIINIKYFVGEDE